MLTQMAVEVAANLFHVSSNVFDVLVNDGEELMVGAQVFDVPVVLFGVLAAKASELYKRRDCRRDHRRERRYRDRYYRFAASHLDPQRSTGLRADDAVHRKSSSLLEPPDRRIGHPAEHTVGDAGILASSI